MQLFLMDWFCFLVRVLLIAILMMNLFFSLSLFSIYSAPGTYVYHLILSTDTFGVMRWWSRGTGSVMIIWMAAATDMSQTFGLTSSSNHWGYASSPYSTYLGSGFPNCTLQVSTLYRFGFSSLSFLYSNIISRYSYLQHIQSCPSTASITHHHHCFLPFLSAFPFPYFYHHENLPRRRSTKNLPCKTKSITVRVCMCVAWPSSWSSEEHHHHHYTTTDAFWFCSALLLLASLVTWKRNEYPFVS